MNKIKIPSDLGVVYNERPLSYVSTYDAEKEISKLKAETDLLKKRYKRWKWIQRERECR